MRNLLICTILFVVACSESESPPRGRDMVDVAPYYNRFLALAQDYGSTVYTSRGAPSFYIQDEIDGKDNVIGQCRLTYYQSGKITAEITLQRNFWMTYGASSKEQLLFHELGHCILGYKGILDTDCNNGKCAHNNERMNVGIGNIAKSMMNSHHIRWDIYELYYDYYIEELFDVEPDPIVSGGVFPIAYYEASLSKVMGAMMSLNYEEYENHVEKEDEPIHIEEYNSTKDGCVGHSH